MKLSLKCRLYGEGAHDPCSGTTDDGTEQECEHWCHTPATRKGNPMISDEPLPEGHTAHALAAALTAAGAPADMVRRAARGYYHDYLSPLELPAVALVHELAIAVSKSDDDETKRQLLQLRRSVISGKYDANEAESYAWAQSPEGAAAFRELLG